MNALRLLQQSEKGKASRWGCCQSGSTEARPSVCRRAATRKSTTVSTQRLSRLHSARPPPLEIRCFIYFFILLHLFLFFHFFNIITIFLPPPPSSRLLPDENARKNNRGIYTLAESKKTIIINYFKKRRRNARGPHFLWGDSLDCPVVAIKQIEPFGFLG